MCWAQRNMVSTELSSALPAYTARVCKILHECPMLSPSNFKRSPRSGVSAQNMLEIHRSGNRERNWARASLWVNFQSDVYRSLCRALTILPFFFHKPLTEKKWTSKLIRENLISFVRILLYISKDRKFTLAHVPICMSTAKGSCVSLFKIMDKRTSGNWIYFRHLPIWPRLLCFILIWPLAHCLCSTKKSCASVSPSAKQEERLYLPNGGNMQ